MTFIDLFSGIGGFRLGMEAAGHKCLGHCEIDKFANYSYIAMHLLMEDEKKEYMKLDRKQAQEYLKNYEVKEWYADDITRVRAIDIPHADCWCFGFPCQDISLAGNREGLTGGKRSSLFFTVTKLIREIKEENKPAYLFVENVKNLLSINNGIDFLKILIELDEIGYDVEWSVINSSDVIPQNRERIFIIGHLRSRRTAKIFPIAGNGKKTNELQRQVVNTITTRSGTNNTVGTYIIEN